MSRSSLKGCALLLALVIPACDDPPTPAAPPVSASAPGATVPAPPPVAKSQPTASASTQVEAGGPTALQIRREGGLVPASEAARILHVGDSMVPLVGNYLRSHLRAKGRKYFIESQISSSTLSWDNKRLLQQAMFKYDPEVVLISLGSNELFDPEPERRAAAIKRLVADTRGRPCLWIGPPAWKKDKGFMEVLQKNLGHCQYLDSVALKLPRMADGRHPSWTGGYRWASAVWRRLGGTDEVPTGSAKKP